MCITLTLPTVIIIAHSQIQLTTSCTQLQAQLVNEADIIVMPHGAAFGDIIFAAQGSVIVHIGATEGTQAECAA